MNDVTACIVTYRSNVSQVAQAVDSFLSAKLNTSVVIIDNASGLEYQTRLGATIGKKATIIHARQNKGFGYGNNLASQHAPDSRYLLFLNPDVVIHEGTLEKLVAYLDEHPEIGAATPKALYADGTLQPLNKRTPNLLDLFLRRFVPSRLAALPTIKRRLDYYAMKDIGYEAPTRVEFMTGCFMLVRSDIWRRVGGFDERFFMYLEDADLTHRINAISQAWYLPVGTITHHWQRGSHYNIKLLGVMLHSIWVYFNKYGWKFW